MTTSNQARALAKAAGGVTALCSKIVRDGRSDVTEHELASLIVEAAKGGRPDLSAEQAFSKMFTDTSSTGETMRKAIAVAKGAPGVDMADDLATAQGEDENDARALQRLTELAQELQAKNPGMSFSQAFDRVYSANRDLALAERRASKRLLGVAV